MTEWTSEGPFWTKRWQDPHDGTYYMKVGTRAQVPFYVDEVRYVRQFAEDRWSRVMFDLFPPESCSSCNICKGSTEVIEVE